MDLDDDDLDKAVGCARERLKKLMELQVELRDIVAGVYDECLAKVQQERTVAQAARRAAHPLNK